MQRDETTKFSEGSNFLDSTCFLSFRLNLSSITKTNSTSASTSTPSFYRAHPLIITWFAISTLVVFWDAGFCLLRPRSMFGGDLHFIWSPYALYETVDFVYGPEAFKNGDGFNSAQAILNLFENALNIIFLYLTSQKSNLAILIGYTSVLLTFWKTSLYWLMDQQCGWCQTGHNSRMNWWILFAAPNSLWVIVPFIIAVIFGRELARRLTGASGLKVKSN